MVTDMHMTDCCIWQRTCWYVASRDPQLGPLSLAQEHLTSGHHILTDALIQGLDATITLKSGEQLIGVFAGGVFDLPVKSQYTLKMVRQVRSSGEAHVNGDSDLLEEFIGEGEDHVMSFDLHDTVSLAVDEVVTASTQPAQNGMSFVPTPSRNHADSLHQAP